MPLPDFDDRPRSPFAWKRWMGARREGDRSRGRRLEAFPLGHFLKGYSWRSARADGAAAANVAVLDFPQALAFATIAGLPLTMGLFGAVAASLLAPLWASSRHLMVGPTNAVAVLTLSGFVSLGYSSTEAVVAMPLLLLLVAAFLIAGAFLRVAAITQFVSRSVLTGYITVAAMTIMVNQSRPLAGLDPVRETAPVRLLGSVVRDFGAAHGPSLAVGALTAAIYLLCRRFARRLPAVAIALFVVTVLASLPFAAPLGIATLESSGLMIEGWHLTLPTTTPGMWEDLVPLAFALAFLSLVESTAIAKTLAARTGERIDPSQQMFSLGVANAGCALGGGMPVSGSLTRSRLNQESGARTPVSSLFSGILLVGVIILVGPYAAAIPKPALAAIIILIGFSLINRANIRLMLSATRSDAAVFMATFTAGLFLPLTTAIFLGTVLSISLFLRKAAQPAMEQHVFTESGQEVSAPGEGPSTALALLHVEGDLFFGSSDIFLDQARRMCADERIRVVIVRLRNARNIDATCAVSFLELLQFSRERGHHVLVSGVRPEVLEVFRDADLLRALGKENLFPDTPDNPTLSTSYALRRARDLLGGESAEIQLFLAPEKKKET